MAGKSNRNPMEISVTKHTSSRAAYVQPQAAEILKSYPREEALFAEVEDEEGEEHYAVGVIPYSSPNSGSPFHKRENGRISMFPPVNSIPIGRYIMRDTPVFESGMDWFILDRIEEE